MTTEPTTNSLQFQPYGPAFDADPHPVLRRFREEAPIYYWEQGRGHVFFRYRDIMALFREPRLGTDPTDGHGFPPELRAAYPDFVGLRDNDLFMVGGEAHDLVHRRGRVGDLQPHRHRDDQLAGRHVCHWCQGCRFTVVLPGGLPATE